jgi:hypothetical protein
LPHALRCWQPASLACRTACLSTQYIDESSLALVGCSRP